MYSNTFSAAGVLLVALCVGMGLYARADALETWQEIPRPEYSPSAERIDLAGTWRCNLDPGDVGREQAWFSAISGRTIRLPGSTDAAGLGEKTETVALDHLTRRYRYVGPAWYQRDIVIPEDWHGKAIHLYLERCHWVSQVWLDQTPLGRFDSLSVPHVYDLTGRVKPGRHLLTVRIDNTPQYGISEFASSITEHSQSNWNGIIGEICLTARARTYIESVRVFPDLEAESVRVEARVHRGENTTASGRVTGQVGGAAGRAEVELKPGINTCSFSIPLPGSTPWGPREPRSYSVRISLTEAGRVHDTFEQPFGMRSIAAKDRHFTLNGESLFLRGTLDAALNPLTGYPPMDVPRWREILGAARDYGLNHVRYHAWCPPEAAFIAANELGMVLQAECPWWGQKNHYDYPDRARFLRNEAMRINTVYGNHPSFALFAMGNEVGSPHGPFLTDVVGELKQYDPRRLYTTASGHFIPREFGHEFVDDFFVSLHTPDGSLRGHQRFTAQQANTTATYTDALRRIQRPMILHETGQWTMFPHLREIEKYTGVLRAGQFEAARDELQRNDLYKYHEDWADASGAFIVELYKEEIESALRTPEVAGFQLLGLTDQMGWGTATIGVLDAFWESKGLITPEAWRRFCGPTVALAEMPRRVWTSNETFTATMTVAHHGREPIDDASLSWTIETQEGDVLDQGALKAATIAPGAPSSLGDVAVPLNSLDHAAHLTLRVTLEPGGYANAWSLWVYPADVAMPEVAADVLVTSDWPQARQALEKGADVFYLSRDDRPGATIETLFATTFWSFGFNPTSFGYTGLYCRDNHPALAQFPTESHSDWQWWDLTHDGRAFIIEALPAGLRPVVEVIDTFQRNQRAAMLLEARVGNGRLLATTFDLDSNIGNRPVARQMRKSLLDYVASERFNPETAISFSEAQAVFHPPVLDDLVVSAPDQSEALLHVVTAAGASLVGTKMANTDGAQQGALVPLEYGLGELTDADQITVMAEGFAYELDGLVGEHAQRWLWERQKTRLTLEVPPGFQGTLYLHFVDWNRLRRRVRLRVNGRLLGDLPDATGQGRWVAVPLDPDITRDGRVTVEGKTVTGPNTLLTEFLVRPTVGVMHETKQGVLN